MRVASRRRLRAQPVAQISPRWCLVLLAGGEGAGILAATVSVSGRQEFRVSGVVDGVRSAVADLRGGRSVSIHGGHRSARGAALHSAVVARTAPPLPPVSGPVTALTFAAALSLVGYVAILCSTAGHVQFTFRAHRSPIRTR